MLSEGAQQREFEGLFGDAAVSPALALHLQMEAFGRNNLSSERT